MRSGRLAAAVLALALLLVSLGVILTLPLRGIEPEAPTTTVRPTLPDTVATLPPITDPHIGTVSG